MGTRIGEVTTNSAILWTRFTAGTVRNNEGQRIKGRAQDYKAGGLVYEWFAERKAKA